MVTINYDIPEALHRKFKALAATRGLTIKELLIQVMQKEVDEASKEVQ